MTVYTLELKVEELDNFPSPQYAIDLCIHICGRILRHFNDKVFWGNPEALADLRCQSFLLFDRLKMLRESAANMLADEIAMRIHYIQVIRRATRYSPRINVRVDLDRLWEVDPRELVEILTRLISTSMKHLTPYVQSVPAQTLSACNILLSTIMRRFASLIRKHMAQLGNCVTNFGNPRRSIIITRVEFQDHVNEVVTFDSKVAAIIESHHALR